MPKRQEPTLTIRLAADLAELLARFVEEQEDWSKTEVVSVALHDFLSGSDTRRIKSLVRFRKRKAEGGSPVAPTRSDRGRAKERS